MTSNIKSKSSSQASLDIISKSIAANDKKLLECKKKLESCDANTDTIISKLSDAIASYNSGIRIEREYQNSKSRYDIDNSQLNNIVEKGKNLADKEAEKNQQINEVINNSPNQNIDKLEEVIKTKEKLEDTKGQVVESIGRVNETITQISKGLETKKELEQQRKFWQKKFDTSYELKKLCSGQAFLEFIAEEYIHEFISIASVTMSKLTGGKYTLEYEKDFLVRDFSHSNECRKISTLSGGETFLASLSIAIAISSIIRKECDYNFFLLDEGFGTLDMSSIDTVVEALYSLSKDTLVGVISHRSEIVERISSKIIVTPCTDIVGSKIDIVT